MDDLKLVTENLFWIVVGAITTTGTLVFGFIWNYFNSKFNRLDDGIKEVDNKISMDLLGMEKEILKLRVYVAENFCTKQEIRDGFDKIERSIKTVYDKLDHKADK